MPTYDFKCETCESITTEHFRIADRPESVTCACGGTAKHKIGTPMVLKESYHDGIKRKGWAEMREASKLNKEAAVSSGSSRKSIEKEIRKLGVTIKKDGL